MEAVPQIPEKKQSGIFGKFLKFIFWLAFFVLIIIITGVALVYYYEDEVKAIIVKELNKNLRSEVKVDPKNIDLSIAKTFPECALQFKKVLILEALNRKLRDTLIYAENISLLFNVKDLWNKNYTVHKVSVSDARCKLQIIKSGESNYVFWKSSGNATAGDSVNFALEKIELTKVNVQYKNALQKIKTDILIEQSDFSGKFRDAQYTMKTEGKATLNYLHLNKASLLKNKNIKYDFDVSINESDYKFTKANISLNEMSFSVEGGLNYKDSIRSANLVFNGEKIDVVSVISLLPEPYANRIKDYESSGVFFATGQIKYQRGKTNNITAEFGIKNASVIYKPKNTQLKKLNMTGKLNILEYESSLDLQNISAELGTNTFNGSCTVTNFKNPILNINANIKTQLEELNSFWPIDTLQYISGSMEMKMALKGPYNEMQASAFSPHVKTEGSVNLKNIKTKFKGKENEINIKEGDFVLNNRNVSVSNFNLLVGASDIKLTGDLPDFLNYLFDSKMPLKVNAELKSEKLILEDILYFNQTSGENKRVDLPDNFFFNLRTEIAKLNFSNFEAGDLSGEMDIRNQRLAIKDLQFNTMDGKCKLSAFADAGSESILITANAELSNINISKLFYQCNNFGQNLLNDKHLKGFATSTIDISGEWSRTLQANLKSITATGNLSVDKGELISFKPLESLSKYIEVQELKDIKFSTLQSSFDIKNSIITLPKTTIKNSAMNIEVWGRHSFNNEIEYHIQLLLSELLANKKRANKQLDEEMNVSETDPENRRSVYILMTGTVDNPIIKYDRKGLRQKIAADIKTEKQNLKQLLKEEFGLFKKDSTLNKRPAKSEQNFKIEFGDKHPQKPNTLQPKKKEDDDDDF